MARVAPTTRSCRPLLPATSCHEVAHFFERVGVPESAMAERGARARNLCFTLFHDQVDETADDFFFPLLDPSLWPDCKYCVYQLERCPDTGRLHYQGYVEFTGVKRYQWVQQNCDGLERAHFEVRRGTMEEARNYAMKMETRLDGPWEWGAPKPGQGSRSDLIHVKRALDEGRSMAYIGDNFFGTFLRYQRGLKEYKRIKMPKRDWAMEVVLIIGPSGTNKSRYCRQNYPDAYWKDGTKWWDDYDGQETVVWDEFYGHCCKYSDLLRLLDRYPMKVETKGGYVEFTSRRIVFTSNQEPEQWYNAERTHQMVWAQNPLNRRIREFGRILRTGAVHQGPQAPQNWDGMEYVDLMAPAMRPPEIIDLDNPNQFSFE